MALKFGSLPQRLRQVFVPDEHAFVLLLLGETVSLLGNHFYFLTHPWLKPLRQADSGLAFGSVLMVNAVARGMLVLVGGGVADRLPPRSILIFSNVIRCMLGTLMGILVLSDRIALWHLFAFAFVFGALDAFYVPAMRSIVASLVAPQRLRRAYAWSQGSLQLSALIGPAIAGAVVAVTKPGAALLIDAATFGAAALSLLLINAPFTSPSVTATHLPADGQSGLGKSIGRGGRDWWRELRSTIGDGFRYAWREPAIQTIVPIAAALNCAFAGPLYVGVWWLVDKKFSGGPSMYGLLMSASGCGGLVGAILAGAFAPPRRLGRFLVCVAAFLGVGISLIGLVPSAGVAAFVLAAIGVGAGYINVTVPAALLARVDPVMRARVMSLVLLSSFGVAPLSYLIAGALVKEHGTLLFAGSGAIVVVAAGVSLISGRVRTLDAANA